MPIAPENRHRYPPKWNENSRRIRFERAEGRCECTGHPRSSPGGAGEAAVVRHARHAGIFSAGFAQIHGRASSFSPSLEHGDAHGEPLDTPG